MAPPLATDARARPAREADAALAAAARSGDRAALDVLFRAHLPMIYNLVRQALGGSPDVDDVVQDVLLRALSQLPGLHEPDEIRPWLAAIAVREIDAYLVRQGAAVGRTAPLDAAAWKPDAGFEGSALLRVELASQRRRVRNASRWLSAPERTVLSLWWLETAGELSRSGVAAALRVSAAHAGVRVQRMREQLDLSRGIVAALEAVPGCAELDAVIEDWNGVPSPFWRKRIARHTRSCPDCARAAEGLIPAERLLAGVAPVPVPAVLVGAAARIATSGITPTGVAAAVGRILTVVRPRPWFVAVTAGAALLAAVIVAVGALSGPPSSSSAPVLVTPSTAAPPPVLPAGRLSLESVNLSGRFVSVADHFGDLATVDAGSGATARRRATLEVVAGIADRQCYSFGTADGGLLRHSSWRLQSAPEETTVLFSRDATFCARAGSLPGTVSLESYNYPGWFIRHAGTELWVDQGDKSAKFRSDSSFWIRPALA